MLWWLIQNLIVATAMAAVVFVVCRFRRIGPAGRHVLWTIVLVKLVTPPLVFWPWPAPQFVQAIDGRSVKQGSDKNLSEPHESQVSAEKNSGPPVAVGGAGDLSKRNSAVVHSETIVVVREPENAQRVGEPTISVPPATVDAAPDATKTDDSAATVPSPWWKTLPWKELPWTLFAGGVWLAGSLLVLIRNGILIARMNGLARAAAPAPEMLATQVGCWSARLGVRPPPVRVSNRITSPMIWAAGRPLLLWPERFADEAESNTWQGVLVHELAHLKRRDHWVGRIELLAACVWWWNPLFWYVRYQVRENAELACDAWVVGTLPEGRRAYAEALLLVCETMSPASAPIPALGVGSGSRRHLERRLTMILREKVPFRASRSVVLAVVVLALVTLPGWTQSKKEPLRDTPADPPATSPSSVQKSTPDTEEPANSATRIKSTNRPPTTRRAPFGRFDPPAPQNLATSQNRVRNAGPIDSEPEPTPQGLQLKVRQLQREIERLRDRNKQLAPASEAFAPGHDWRKPGFTRENPRPRLTNRESPKLSVQENDPGLQGPSNKSDRIVATHTITLQRTTYQLPSERAKALQAFLQQHVKAEVLQIEIGRIAVRTSRVYPNVPKNTVLEAAYQSVIKITTTPDVQKVIGQLISVMRKDEPLKDRPQDTPFPARARTGTRQNGTVPNYQPIPNPSPNPRATKPTTRPARDRAVFPSGESLRESIKPTNTK